MNVKLRPIGRSVLAALLVAAASARGARGQSPAPAIDADSAVCLAFAFGAWHPALDWHAAGHDRSPDRIATDSAGPGRDWASDATAAAGDSALLLFPRWWPVGVAVTLPSRRPAAGDTVRGRAVALVGRGDVPAPTTAVRAWRVSCAAPPLHGPPRTGPGATATPTRESAVP